MRVHSPDEEWVKCVSIVTLCELNCPGGTITLDRILHVASLVRLMVQDLSPRTRSEWNEPLAEAVRLAFLHAVRRLDGFSRGSGGGGSGIGTGDEATGGAGDSREGGRGGDGARADGADKEDTEDKEEEEEEEEEEAQSRQEEQDEAAEHRRGGQTGVGAPSHAFDVTFAAEPMAEPMAEPVAEPMAEPTSLEAATAPECPGVLGAVSTEESSGQGQASSLKGGASTRTGAAATAVPRKWKMEGLSLLLFNTPQECIVRISEFI